MPSKALKKLETTMMRDVDRIIESYEIFLRGKQGKHALGHFGRSAVLLLCAAWELYVEEVIIEAVKILIDRSSNPDDLPKEVQKTISKYVKSSSHELKPLALAGDGWKTIYLDLANESVALLNTPRSNNINALFKSLVGIDDITRVWTKQAEIESFISKRGDIAHKGSESGYVKVKTVVNKFRPCVLRTANEMDNEITNFIRNHFKPAVYPWNRRALT